MDWFNYMGLIIICFLMIPNVVYAVVNKNKQKTVYKNKAIEAFEQMGRYGSMTFMIFNIPYTYCGFFFEQGKRLYIIVNAILLLAYVILFFALLNKNSLNKNIILSVLPSIIFLFSGIMIVSVPLIIFSLIFSIFHIYISVKSVLLSCK